MERELPDDEVGFGQGGLFRGHMEHAVGRDHAELADGHVGERKGEFLEDRGVGDGFREVGMTGDKQSFHGGSFFGSMDGPAETDSPGRERVTIAPDPPDVKQVPEERKHLSHAYTKR